MKKKILALFTAISLLSASAFAFKVGGMNWVTSDGTANQAMITDGNANLGWKSFIDKTYITATAPLVYSSSTGVIFMTKADATHAGYVSLGDWTNFNNRITGLTSDVSATGPTGSDGPQNVAATVNTVGGSTAADIHTAELLANAATNVNTASTIVKRDSSGNFNAGQIKGSAFWDTGLTASTALIADGSTFLASSSTTSTELTYVHGVTSAIQTQLGTKVDTVGSFNGTSTAKGLDISSTSIALHAADASNPGALSTSAQDVAGQKTLLSAPIFNSLTASLPLKLDASKVATAAAIALGGSEVSGTLPNAKTTADSANTASAIVTRDVSGNFSAGTVTASLTGNVTGNVTGAVTGNVTGNLTGNVTGDVTGTASGNTTYTANQYGVVLSGSGNAMSVLAPDSSTSKILKSGGASANPSWLAFTNANTASTVVSRDSSGDFSAGTISAALSGNATTATTATNATNVATTAVSSNATYYPLFVASSSNGNQASSLGTGLTFNPSTNALTTTTFSGALSGNATTATSATSATNATNTAITDDTTTNATMYPTWVTTTTGNLPQKVSSSKMTFNPSTGTLVSTVFSGSGASLTSLSGTNISSGTVAASVGGTGTTSWTTGSIPYYTGSVIGQNNTSLFWANTTNTNNLSIGSRTSTDGLAQVNINGTADFTATGTTTTNASTTITGSGTAFLSEIAVGDWIALSSASSTFRIVTAIASDTSLTVQFAMGTGASQTISVRKSPFRINSQAPTIGALTFNRDGQLLIGSPIRAVTAPQLQLNSSTASNPDIVQGDWSSGATGATHTFVKSRSGAVGTFAALLASDAVGTLLYRGIDSNNSTTLRNVAQIQVTVDSSPSGGVIPGVITMSTTNSSGTMTTGLSIDSTQLVTMPGPVTMSNAAVKMTGITTGTNADTVCLSSSGTVLIQAAACTISSRRFKENIFDLDDHSGLESVMQMRPVEFNMKPGEKPNADMNYGRTQVGLIAEDIAKIDPRLAIYEQDGVTPKSYRQEALIGVLVKAIQEQQEQIEELKAKIH